MALCEKKNEGDHRPDDGEHDGKEREHVVEAPEKTGSKLRTVAEADGEKPADD